MTKELYEAVAVNARNPQTIRQALAVIEESVPDMRAFLIREFNYSFDEAQQIDRDDVSAAVLDEILKRHDPMLQTEKTIAGLMGELHATREEIVALAVQMLDHFYIHLNEKFSMEVVNEMRGREIIHTLMRFAAYDFEALYDLWSKVGAESEMRIEQNLLKRLSNSERSVWWRKLNLELERDFVNSEAYQIGECLLELFENPPA